MTKMILGEYIWSTKFDIDITQIKDKAYEIRSNNPNGRIVSNVGGYQSLTPIFDETCDILIENIEKYSNEIIAKDLELTNSVEFKLLELWVNINRTSHKNIPHVHLHHDYNRLTTHSILSGTFYVQIPPKSGGIVFTKNNFSDVNIPIQFIKNPNNKYWAKQHQFSPSAGDCLFWFSDIPHFVEENNSNEDRISFSFNLQLDIKQDK